MNNNFPRIITLLRKEKGFSQKQVAADLEISQALLSHYEKGIRECGLDFVVKIAEYYGVSCDYLLGRTPDRTGATIKVEDLPEPDAAGKDNTYRGSLLPTLNKKLIANSMNIIFDILQKSNHKNLTNEVSAYLMLSVYKMFRLLYSANAKKSPRHVCRTGGTATGHVFRRPVSCGSQGTMHCAGKRNQGMGGAQEGKRLVSFAGSHFPAISSFCFFVV